MTDINDTIEKLKAEVAELQKKNETQAAALQSVAAALGTSVLSGLHVLTTRVEQLKNDYLQVVAEKNALALHELKAAGHQFKAGDHDQAALAKANDIIEQVREIVEAEPGENTVEAVTVLKTQLGAFNALRRDWANVARVLGLHDSATWDQVHKAMTKTGTSVADTQRGFIVDVVNECGSKAFRLAHDCDLETLINRIRNNQDALRQSEFNNNTLERVLGEVTELCGVRPAGAIAYASDPGWSKRVVDHLQKKLEQSYKDRVDELTRERDNARRECSQVKEQLDDCYKENARCAEHIEELRKRVDEQIFPATCTLVVCDGGFKVKVP